MTKRKYIKYPLKEMEVGDSFVVKLDGESKKKVRSRISTIAQNHRRGTDKKFTVKVFTNEIVVCRLK